ncbi:hypothetical protein EVAR_958_1 [Eumeta japonica]|uniref:Uncharacterized protein n=1 Tax=Eumeta variegata TaxID=151549 RepID=A0A4C1SE15_EUMVA|nr:hypothetical protein EVAR_958_1 [Eumeta japonica]
MSAAAETGHREKAFARRDGVTVFKKLVACKVGIRAKVLRDNDFECAARGRPIIVEWERDARHSAASLVRSGGPAALSRAPRRSHAGFAIQSVNSARVRTKGVLIETEAFQCDHAHGHRGVGRWNTVTADTGQASPSPFISFSVVLHVDAHTGVSVSETMCVCVYSCAHNSMRKYGYPRF